MRTKLDQLYEPIASIMVQSTPLTRSADYHPDDPKFESLKDDVEFNESKMPMVGYGIFCFTNMAPSDPGNKPARFLKTPELHMFAGSKQKVDWMKDLFETGDFQPVLHKSFNTFADSFKGEGAKKMSDDFFEDKEPGPRNYRAKRSRK